MNEWNPDEPWENLDFEGALSVSLSMVGRRVEVSIEAAHPPYGHDPVMAAIGTFVRAEDIMESAGDVQREMLWFSFAEWEDERTGFFFERSRFQAAEAPSDRDLLAVTLNDGLRLVVKLITWELRPE